MDIIVLGLLLFISVLIPLGLHGAFNPTDNYLIDCGSPVDTPISSRTFVADKPTSWTISNPERTILASTNSNVVSSYDAALYRTARIFTGFAYYSIPIQNRGPHWIRLYFFPFQFQGLDLAKANFSVTAQEFILLFQFQAPIDSTPLFKEYLVNVRSSSLTISFLPSSGNSNAFVNAIEVVSVPDGLFSNATPADPSVPQQNIPGLALETMHRINMGGPEVFPMNDTLTRTWLPDQSYLLNKNLAQSVAISADQIHYIQGEATEEFAPASIYSTATGMANANIGQANFNVTWDFPVDPSFLYLVRFHFCDIVSTEPHKLVFNVYINSQAVLHDFDLNTYTFSTMAAPYIVDFVAGFSDGSGNKFRISIGPSTLPDVLQNATLNGLEIMKLSNTLGSLDGNVSASNIIHATSKNKRIGLILGCVFGLLGAASIATVFFMVLRRRKLAAKKRHSETGVSLPTNEGISQSSGGGLSNGTPATPSSGHGTNLGFCFSLAAVQEAANNFDEKWVIGVGGFGKVYKGVLRDGTRVAVKRGNPKSQQGRNEFLTEIELLSQLRHRHLVSLIGYCDQQNEMILVYEYMKKGTLKSHLYGSGLPSLSWKQRLEICIGAARGIHYLHTGHAKAIIHRDVKSANILLDENLTAKVADFGLSKTLPELDRTHVSTAVKGSFGYLDPEYFRRQQLTEKSDVYSFGVVLLEVLCARPVIDPTLPREMVNLAEWAMEWQRRGRLQQVADARIAGTIRADSLRKFGEIVEKCLAEYGVDRPSMTDVLWSLQYVRQLQEEVVSSFLDIDSVNRIPELAPRIGDIGNLESVATEEEGVETATGADLSSVTVRGALPTGTENSGVSTSRVFSQLDFSGVSETNVFSQLMTTGGR